MNSTDSREECRLGTRFVVLNGGVEEVGSGFHVWASFVR
jgi:hypothetical protein